MEIPEPSSISQANARFSGLTNSQIQDCIARIYPFPQNEKIHSAKYVSQAISSTGAHKDFREKDYVEGHRMLQGVLTNPWISVADISHPDRTDISYMDSGYSDVKDLQTQMIGQLAGAPQLNDPRHVFVENLLKMKIHQKNPDNNSYDYMKDLFLTQIDHGMSYYQNQAMAQKLHHDTHTSEKLQNIKPFDHSQTIRSATVGTMEVSHAKRPRDMVVRTSGVFSHNTKRAKLDELHARFSSQIPTGEYDDIIDPITPEPSVSSAQSSRNSQLGGGHGTGGGGNGTGGGGAGSTGGGGGSGSGSQRGGRSSAHSHAVGSAAHGIHTPHTPHHTPPPGGNQAHGTHPSTPTTPSSPDALGISPSNTASARSSPLLSTTDIYGSGSPSLQGGIMNRFRSAYEALTKTQRKAARDAILAGESGQTQNPAFPPSSLFSTPTRQLPTRQLPTDSRNLSPQEIQNIYNPANGQTVALDMSMFMPPESRKEEILKGGKRRSSRLKKATSWYSPSQYR